MDRNEQDALSKLRTALDHLRAAEKACEAVGYSRMNVLDPLMNLRLDLTVVIATVSDGDGEPAAPKPPKCPRCMGERTIDQTGYGEYRPCPNCNPESPYYEPPASSALASSASPVNPAREGSGPGEHETSSQEKTQ